MTAGMAGYVGVGSGCVYRESFGADVGGFLAREASAILLPVSARRRPFPLLHLRPAELDGVVLDFHWDAERLRRLDLPEAEVQVRDLAWHLELPFWSDNGLPFRVTPMQVAAAPNRYPQQYARTISSDLAYPLDVLEHLDGKTTILDGVHRLLNAHLRGLPSVRVRVLQWAELDAIAV